MAEHTSSKAAHKQFLIVVWHDSARVNGLKGVIRSNIDNAQSHESQPGATHNDLTKNENGRVVLPGLPYGPVCLIRGSKLTTALSSQWLAVP